MELHYSKGKRPEDEICNVASSTFYQPSRPLHSMYFIYIHAHFGWGPKIMCKDANTIHPCLTAGMRNGDERERPP